MSAADLVSALAPVGLELAKLGIEAARGEHKDPAEVVRQLLGLGVKLVPPGELKEFLTIAGRMHAESIANVLEEEKFGPPDDDGEP